MSSSTKFKENLPLSIRVVELLKSKEAYGGPQSVDDLCKNLGISNARSRSALVRLRKAGKIERMRKGIYCVKGDTRTFSKNKPHFVGN